MRCIRRRGLRRSDDLDATSNLTQTEGAVANGNSGAICNPPA